MAAHKWWRINNIIDRVGTQDYLAAAEIHFYNNNYINAATDQSKAFSSETYINDSNYSAGKAFDNNPSTFASGNIGKWIIGYQFNAPINIVAMGVKGRNDLPARLGREWQSATIEYSDDGLVWYKKADININTPAESSELIVVYIGDHLDLGVSTGGQSIYINVYTTDESGSFSGRITDGLASETKLPLVTDVALYDRMTHKLLQITRSDALGAYTFSGLDANREYYVTALHPTRKYNAVIQDGLTSGLVS